MAKKETLEAASAAYEPERAADAEAPKQAKTCAAGIYIYIGPNIKNYIQTGTIYRGDRANALNRAAPAIAAYPQVKTLIVSGDALAAARVKVRTPGNALYAAYEKLAGKE